MSDRSIYLVAYDIRDPKRLRLVHKKMMGFGDAVQFSVFQCELSRAEKQLMIGALSEIIQHNEDRVLIVEMGRRKGRVRSALQVLGRQELPPERGPVVV
jgi:CRISPR-associated protein Cas2